ncbi:MAG: N-formylglutamate amidohydrolase [Bacteroidales bacterium]|nr:N-formylglutamate amidohydrolase [Bacteroidales bacterium]MCF8406014.1 N-formylglutamate amidohydrolase [Bacteroidales bacterium]
MKLKSILLGIGLVPVMFYTFVVSAQDFVPGESYFLKNKYVEYIHGNLPLVISVPHGGYEIPDDIPERMGKFAKNQDIYTIEIAEEIRKRVFELTGKYPYIVINHLHRTRFDANRALDEAADGNKIAEAVWYAYHQQIDSVEALITKDFGKGLFIDLHGHRHSVQRIEIGYLISDVELRQDADFLNDGYIDEYSSIRNLLQTKDSTITFTDIIRGDHSLGSLLSAKGQVCVPDNTRLFPEEGEPYFSGGYNTMRHGSSDGGTIDGIQIEIDLTSRTDIEKRMKISDDIALSLLEFLSLYYFPEDEVLASFGQKVLMAGE